MSAPFRPLDHLRAIRTSDLTGHEKAIAVWLTTYADEQGEAFPSLETLAAASGFSRATVMRAVADLREHGWLTTRRARRTASTTYQLVVPSKSLTATSQGATSHAATSPADTGEVAAGDPRSRCQQPSKSLAATRSASLSAHPSAQGSAGPLPDAPVQPPTPTVAVTRRPPGVLAHETTFLVAAYERKAAEVLGHKFPIDPGTFGLQHTLASILEFCPDGEKANAQPWLEREVEAFIRAVRKDEKWGRGFDPKDLLAWLKKGRQGATRPIASPAHRRLDTTKPTTPKDEPLPLGSPEAAEAARKGIAALIAGVGGGFGG